MLRWRCGNNAFGVCGQLLKNCPLLVLLDISHEVVPTRRRRVQPGHVDSSHHLLPAVRNDPLAVEDAVTAVGLSQLWPLVPHLTSLNVSECPGVNILPVELLKLSSLTKLTATPHRIVFPPAVWKYCHGREAMAVSV